VAQSIYQAASQAKTFGDLKDDVLTEDGIATPCLLQGHEQQVLPQES